MSSRAERGGRTERGGRSERTSERRGGRGEGRPTAGGGRGSAPATRGGRRDVVETRGDRSEEGSRSAGHQEGSRTRAPRQDAPKEQRHESKSSSSAQIKAYVDVAKAAFSDDELALIADQLRPAGYGVNSSGQTVRDRREGSPYYANHAMNREEYRQREQQPQQQEQYGSQFGNSQHQPQQRGPTNVRAYNDGNGYNFSYSDRR